MTIVNTNQNLDDIQTMVGLWATKTFPDQNNDGIIRHLIDEVLEFIDSEEPSEAADVAILLLDYCHRNHISLQTEILKKMEINKKRKWSTEPNEKGFFPHVE